MTSRTYTNTQTANPLCDRMQKQFRDRVGTAVRTGTRVETSEMLARVRSGLDPYENVPNPARKTVSEVRAPRNSAVNTGAYRPASAQTAARPAANAARPQAAPRTASSAQAKTAARPQTAVRTKPMREYTAPASENTGAVHTAWGKWRAHRNEVKRARAILRDGEVKVKMPFPASGVFMLAVLTVVSVVLLYNFTQNYELRGEIAALHDDAYRLQQLQRSLEIQLEERDDIRTIEKIAVEELGMVKYDLVESRFVSISGGDRIELTEEESEAVEAGLWSTMLSAVGEGFSRIREYIE